MTWQYDRSILSPPKISDWFLALWTQGLRDTTDPENPTNKLRWLNRKLNLFSATYTFSIFSTHSDAFSRTLLACGIHEKNTPERSYRDFGRVALRDLTSDDTAESKYKQTWQQTKRQASKKVNKQVHCRAVSKNLSQKYRIICKI